MITAQNRWTRLWVATIVALSMGGCATSKPPYILETKVLTPERFSSQQPPKVRVRIAGPEEVEPLTEFPGKKDQELSAQIDGLVSLLLAPALFVFFWPEFFNPDNWHIGKDRRIKEALEQFPKRLHEAIEQRFPASSSGESGDLLEIVYVADVSTIGPAADRSCFVLHAQMTFQSKGEVVYRETLRIDPRSFSDDMEQPDCTQSPGRILDYADQVVPRMIETRLPGLPWKPKP
jgi:hypothetical protein